MKSGVVPSQLGVEEVPSTRNATLARLLAETPDAAGTPVSENRGSGLPHVMTRPRRAGMSPPRFDVEPGHVHVTVPQHALLDPPTVEWIATLSAPSLADEQQIALALQRATGSVTNEMLRAWGADSHTATAALRGLVERGLAVKLGGPLFHSELVGPPGYDSWAPRDQQATVLPEVLISAPASGQRRIASELEAVLQAVRAGHVTVRALSERLDLSYTTATRRVNALLADGRHDQTASPHSRKRTFIAPGSSRAVTAPP